MFPKLRDYYNLGPDQGGVLIDYLIPDDGPDKFGLKRNDILVSIDDNDIDDYGEIFFKPLDQKVFFSEVLNRKKVGDPLKIKVIRAGKVIELNGPMTKGLPKLVSTSFTRANYFILAGVGFVELTVNCIENLEKTGESLKAKYGDEFPKRPYQKIVIISEIFPEYELVDTSGYLKRVMKVNGEDVLNLEQLYTKLAVLKEKGEARAILELAQNVQLPLDLQQAPELDKQIQKNHGILYMKTPGGFVVQ
jgi:hypothetical protein